MDPAEGLAVVRLVEEVKSRAGVVARLMHGSAWFASLARETEAGKKGGAMYGRDGASARDPAPPSVERKA